MKVLIESGSNSSWNCPFGLFYELKSFVVEASARVNGRNYTLSEHIWWVQCILFILWSVLPCICYLPWRASEFPVWSATMGCKLKKWQTLFGAIPALTVSLVSRKTSSLIWLTHSSAVRERCSQYWVTLILHEERKWQRGVLSLLEISFVTPPRTHVWIISTENPHDLFWQLHIPGETIWHENKLRAQFLRNKA